MPATVAAPDRPEHLEEALLDPKITATLMDSSGHLDPAKFQAWLNEHWIEDADKRVYSPTELRDALKGGLEDFYKANNVEGRKLPIFGDSPAAIEAVYKDLGLNQAQRRAIAANGRGPAMALFGKYKSFGDFLLEQSKVINAMGESDVGSGGALVPEEYRATLQYLELETAIIRPGATVIPMGSATVRIPGIFDASHASTVMGGVSTQWLAEAASVATNSQPTFKQIVLQAHKLTGYTIAANELLADSAIGLEALIMTLFGQALGFFEDDAFIGGLGAGQPLGILNADALVTVAKEAGQAAATIVYQNIVKMFSRVHPSCLSRAIWYTHIDTFPQLAQMALNVGTGGSAVWIGGNGGAVGAPPVSILGRPVVFTEKAQSVGTAGDIVLADRSKYLIGDRQSLQVGRSEHVNFTTDQMTWRFIQRVDGRPWVTTALTPRHGTNTLSCFVALATRA